MSRTHKRTSQTGMGASLMKKHFGQHLLRNPLVVKSIVEKAKIKPTDIVLEIGPGTGNLTVKLLEKAKRVIAIEFDPRMVVELQKRMQGHQYAKKLEIIQGDAIKIDFPFFNVCVANLPYNISSPFVFKLLTHEPIFRHAVVMFQREFAMRLIARPENNLYCRLSVNTQLLSEVKHLLKVAKNNFKPPPKVDSSVVMIKPRNPRPEIQFTEWDGFIRLCFLRKNKTLGAIFKQKKVLLMLEENYKTYTALKNIRVPKNRKTMKEMVLGVLEKTKYMGKRARTLDIDDFLL
ncbi:dimethyladenosine transferase-related [Anaeramoeba flamelloides]|uniref:rRNA adenine N(6)-methyltransferase n=1 Tax=Anaeramoeba flamelloides TaxID=1746091 RepID=A0AAV7YFL2_9EUKA|nr:dimethyladenosine transferase-related [Anaeramoeba flamelloides]